MGVAMRCCWTYRDVLQRFDDGNRWRVHSDPRMDCNVHGAIPSDHAQLTPHNQLEHIHTHHQLCTHIHMSHNIHTSTPQHFPLLPIKLHFFSCNTPLPLPSLPLPSPPLPPPLLSSPLPFSSPLPLPSSPHPSSPLPLPSTLLSLPLTPESFRSFLSTSCRAP